jgi:hypothetical protein
MAKVVKTYKLLACTHTTCTIKLLTAQPMNSSKMSMIVDDVTGSMAPIERSDRN